MDPPASVSSAGRWSCGRFAESHIARWLQLQFTVPWNCSRQSGKKQLDSIKKGEDKNVPIQSSLEKRNSRVMVLQFWGHTACVALSLFYTSSVFLSSAASSGFYTTKSHRSVSPGQELLGFSSKIPTASQWTQRTHPVCPICFSSSTLTSPPPQVWGHTRPLSPYPCHRRLHFACAGPSDPEYTHSYSISCPNTSPNLSGICLACTAFLSPVLTTW